MNPKPIERLVASARVPHVVRPAIFRVSFYLRVIKQRNMHDRTGALERGLIGVLRLVQANERICKISVGLFGGLSRERALAIPRTGRGGLEA